jgi:hypothetical protein
MLFIDNQIRYNLIYLGYFILLLLIKIHYKIHGVRLIFLASIPLLFMILFNVYISIILKEVLIKLLSIKN